MPWLKNSFVQRLGGGRLEQLGLDLWSATQNLALGARKDPADARLIRHVRSKRKCLLSSFECYTLMGIARAQSRIPGPMAEVGVYQGASARLLSAVKGDRTLHLFDTFEGLPPDGDRDGGCHRHTQYACSLESVQKWLAGCEGLVYHKGLFPDSAEGLSETGFSFVHLDVDLYQSTAAGLEYFYPRMAPGGVIVSHDYDILEGVKAAFTEFFADKPEGVIELPTTQCMVICGLNGGTPEPVADLVGAFESPVPR